VRGAVTPVFEVVRSPATARHILATAGEHGLDAGTCLSGTGLTVDDLADSDTEVYAGQELTMIRNLIARLGDRPGLGMETGSRYNLADIGILAYALMSSPTFGDAIDVACRYVALTPSYLSVATPEVTSTEAVIAFDDVHLPHDVRKFLLERDIAILLRILPLLLGARHPPMAFRLQVAHLQLSTVPVQIENLTITVENSSRNALIIPADLVTQPMPAADPQTAAICVRHCETLLHRRSTRRGVSEAIRMRMIQDSKRIPSMVTVAKELFITERTLHRRLAAEGTSFRVLLDEVRATLAAELLNSGLSVEETAHRLGYSETAAFTRAYTRWNGYPPSRRNN